ncbi:SRPBCC family protein [Halobaculum sp. WSA2]|uniref:SRPBCC family protein n=1 Tax=Halobaculum saliterrae TaxID=2073113 RepID=A0A6B0T2N6_9EURY|nr:SRPBCC family protein [Halobaculum saliterrae]MXR42872.1 SRPBCC family protein [Halobaculum saliterrae]
MREVEVERFVAATPDALRRLLTPAALVEYEGSFVARGTRPDGDATVVTVAGGGLEFDLRVTETPDGWRYEQVGQQGPFDAMETAVTLEPANEGSRVRAVSRVSLGLPIPLVDRVAGWKRRGELRRLLDAVAEDA